jgi:hypothetical protein
MVAVGRDGGVWQRVNRKERCPVCGHDSWCGMIVGELVACMRQADGAKFSKPGKDGQLRHYHDWPDRAAPIPIRPAPERPVDWAAPAATTCRALYSAIAARYAGHPRSKACAAEADRRFGDRALDALAASDSFEVDERDLLAWLDAEGRFADAKSAGILTPDGALAPALKGRKVYAFRLPNGEVANLRGRDLTGRSPLKVLDLAGGYEERGADAGLYHAERVADVADGAGWLHLAGGCEKADALLAAGFAAVSTPGEGTLFDAALAELTARRVLSVAVWLDAEDAKEGEALSAGRRLGLAVAERLAGAGISVRVVEPAREPGSPKRDADGILRDGGPGALWDCWAASEDLAAFRARAGVAMPAGAEALRAENTRLRDENARLIAERRTMLRACANEKISNTGVRLTGSAVAFEYAARVEQHFHKHGEQPDFDGWVPVSRRQLAESTGHKPRRITNHLKQLEEYGILERDLRPGAVRLVNADGEVYNKPVDILYVRMKRRRALDNLEELAALDPGEEEHRGGPRACPKHPEADYIVDTTTEKVERCAVCEDELGRTVERHRSRPLRRGAGAAGRGDSWEEEPDDEGDSGREEGLDWESAVQSLTSKDTDSGDGLPPTFEESHQCGANFAPHSAGGYDR